MNACLTTGKPRAKQDAPYAITRRFGLLHETKDLAPESSCSTRLLDFPLFPRCIPSTPATGSAAPLRRSQEEGAYEGSELSKLAEDEVVLAR
jgi:hypothetical protein